MAHINAKFAEVLTDMALKSRVKSRVLISSIQLAPSDTAMPLIFVTLSITFTIDKEFTDLQML